MASCKACGTALPRGSKFCLECGTPVDATSGETAVQELPPHETGEVPVEPQVAERRFFGVPPSTILLVLGLGALALAIFLFATGSWAWGLIFLGISLFLVTGFVSQVRRLPGEASGFSNASLAALVSVRARAGAAVDTVAAHGSARVELMRLRREVAALARERTTRLGELGEAVYAGNRTATKQAKDELKGLDETIQAKQEQMVKVTTEARERIEKAQQQVQPTEVLGGEDEAPEPSTPGDGEPAQAPQPPDEGDLPEQPTIPEPEPGRTGSD
jgi:hypothetical protein